jgi:hypothetical protein
MTALPSKAEVNLRSCDVAEVPESDICTQQTDKARKFAIALVPLQHNQQSAYWRGQIALYFGVGVCPTNVFLAT